MVFTLVQAHAMVMILSWLFFGSTGILFARYGRSVRLGARRQLLGKSVWFQIHRFLLSLTSILTLVGFLLIFARAGGTWVDSNSSNKRLFTHSIFGGIVVCCTTIQVWLALYRCHPQSRFRYVFSLSHRIVGLLAFSLTIPNIFLIVSMWSRNREVLYTIISLWTGWFIIVVFIFEKIESKQTTTVLPVVSNGRAGDRNQNTTNTNSPVDIESATNPNIGTRGINHLKLFIFFIHITVSITLSITLIVFFCK